MADLNPLIESLQQYYQDNPSLKAQSIVEGDTLYHMPQALSGSESTTSHLGVTWPLLLAGALQQELLVQFNAGKMTAPQVQEQAGKYKEQYPNLHSTFVDDVLRNIGYSVKFEGGNVVSEPEKIPQGYINNEGTYLDVNRG